MWSVVITIISSVILALGGTPAMAASAFDASVVGNTIVWWETAPTGESVRMTFSQSGSSSSGPISGTLSGLVVQSGSQAQAGATVYSGPISLRSFSRQAQQSVKDVLIAVMVDGESLDTLGLHPSETGFDLLVNFSPSNPLGRVIWRLAR